MRVGPALVVVALLAPSASAAEEPEIKVHEKVEVRANLPEPEDIAAFATEIDGSELSDRGVDLADLLRRVPGARIRDYGGLGSYATMSLRASTSEQVTVLVDGVPQNRALGGAVDLSSIPATMIDRITVFRGFGPAAYGLGGIGGVVDVRTRRPGSDPQVTVDLIGGELGTARVSGTIVVPTGDSAGLQIDAEALDGDGDFVYLDTGLPFVPDDSRSTRRANNDLRQRSVNVQHVWSDIGGGRLRLALGVQSRERGVPGVDTFQSTSSRLDQRLEQLTASWSRRGDAGLDRADLTIDGFRDVTDYLNPLGEIGLGTQDQTTRLTGGGATATVGRRHGRHRTLARFDLRREEASRRNRLASQVDRGGATRDLFALTAEETLRFGRWSIAPSMRWEHRRDRFKSAEGGTLPPPASDVTEGRGAGKVGVAYLPNDRLQLRGSIGRFHRSPSMQELFGDTGSLAGNPKLQAESGESIELGATYRRPGPIRLLEIVGFARRAEDLIRFRPASQGTARAQNLADVEIFGVEASVDLQFHDGWTAQAGLTLQNAEETIGFAEGSQLPYEPRIAGHVGVGWRLREWQARWEISYVGKNGTDSLDTPVLRIPSRTIHDLNISYSRPNGLELGLDVRNLFDRRIRDVARFPLPDRVILFHLGWRT